GIPAAAARQVFQAFERGQHVDATTPGVGLGLALAQRWARLLGGQLELLPATEGTGVRFRLSLPSNAAG
ncbi:MAG TPA: ATP-binding protein, partial [Gemmatales bacterium]|nr:ATP-binding protein [Gemmatales bacterium]